MLNWSGQFSIFLFLDSNDYTLRHGRYECLLMADPIGAPLESLEAVAAFYARGGGWLGGHICYDYKNIVEPRLRSGHPARFTFPLLSFFLPRIVCYIERGRQELVIECVDTDPESVFNEIVANPEEIAGPLPKLSFTSRTSREHYLDTVQALREHIAAGDCYEITYCTEGYVEDCTVDPLEVFCRLNTISPAPFAACYRVGHNYLMSASPERYLYRQDNLLCAQPIKGTIRRDADSGVDARLKEELYQSIKERAENVMIVDLVRNDLARASEVGSVYVEELFGIYTFPQVHQMVSTICGRLEEGRSATDAIHYSFPMGSMTGAPKIKVMELIEHYESARRELFSGTVGYFTPSGDFDFNVVIRSLFYNGRERYLSFQTGGAITYDSDPVREWEEMRLKAWAMERVFSGS